jgi:hypothetical protein
MYWWVLLVAWVGGWLITLIVSARCKKKQCATSFVNEELLKDANSTFSTGLIYFVVYLVCYFINVPLVTYIAAGILTLFCFPPLYSYFFTVIKQAIIFKDKEYAYALVTSFICTFMPILFPTLMVIEQVNR